MMGQKCWRKIRRRPLVALSLIMVGTGCQLNTTTRLPLTELRTPADRAAILFGLAGESESGPLQFEVTLEHYDLNKQDASGDCFRDDSVTATISPTMSGIEYFAFDAPAGPYVLRPWRSQLLAGDFVSLTEPTRAFLAEAGTATYIGDFTYVGEKEVPLMPSDRRAGLQASVIELRSNVQAAEAATGTKLMVAKTVEVRKPRHLVCGPLL